MIIHSFTNVLGIDYFDKKEYTNQLTTKSSKFISIYSKRCKKYFVTPIIVNVYQTD